MYWLSSLEYACNCSIEYVDVAFHLSLGLTYHMWVFTRCPRLPYRGFVFGGALLCASCLSTRSQNIQLLSCLYLSYPQIVYLLIVRLAACQALVRRCMIWHVHPFLFLCVGTVLLPTIICERFHGSCFIWILQPHALCSQFASYLGSISIGTLIVAHSFHFHSFFPLALVAFVIVWQHYWPSSVIRQTADIHLFFRSPNILARGSHIAGSTTSQIIPTFSSVDFTSLLFTWAGFLTSGDTVGFMFPISPSTS